MPLDPARTEPLVQLLDIMEDAAILIDLDGTVLMVN